MAVKIPDTTKLERCVCVFLPCVLPAIQILLFIQDFTLTLLMDLTQGGMGENNL